MRQPILVSNPFWVHFCIWCNSPVFPFIKETILSSWYILGSFVKNQCVIYARPYFWALSSVSVIYISAFMLHCFLLRFYLVIFREGKRGRKRRREISMCKRNISQLPLTHPQPGGTWHTTQACALTGNWTGDLLVCRMMPSPLSHTSQGYATLFWLPYPCSIVWNQEVWCLQVCSSFSRLLSLFGIFWMC